MEQKNKKLIMTIISAMIVLANSCFAIDVKNSSDAVKEIFGYTLDQNKNGNGATAVYIITIIGNELPDGVIGQ